MTAYNPSKWMYSTWAGFSCVTSSFSLILRLPCKLRWSCWRSFAIWKSYFYHQQKMEGRNKQTNSDTKSKLKPYSPTPDDCCILDDMTYIKNITAVSNLTGFTKQCSMSFWIDVYIATAWDSQTDFASAQEPIMASQDIMCGYVWGSLWEKRPIIRPEYVYKHIATHHLKYFSRVKTVYFHAHLYEMVSVAPWCRAFVYVNLSFILSPKARSLQ